MGDTLKYPTIYAVKHKNENTRMASRSGGVFTAISDLVLSCGGVVYGCVLTDDFKALHVRAETENVRDKMRGSKYIQSSLGDIFNLVKKDLCEEKVVLFSGTSCQIDGLKAYLKKDYEKLLCLDIVCHGVPSEKVWLDYIKWQEKENKAKCIEVDFRNKIDFGWGAHIETLTMESSTGERFKVNSRVYTQLFYSHVILRPCCYKCPYKSIIHSSDITIADYWGIDMAAPGFNDDRGVSLVLINNIKGAQLFDAVKRDIIYKETRIEDSLQPPLLGPFEKPSNREYFWENYGKRPFGEVAFKVTGFGTADIERRCKDALKKYLKPIYKAIKK